MEFPVQSITPAYAQVQNPPSATDQKLYLQRREEHSTYFSWAFYRFFQTVFMTPSTFNQYFEQINALFSTSSHSSRLLSTRKFYQVLLRSNKMLDKNNLSLETIETTLENKGILAKTGNFWGVSCLLQTGLYLEILEVLRTYGPNFNFLVVFSRSEANSTSLV